MANGIIIIDKPAENDCILFASCGKVLLRKTLVRAIRRGSRRLIQGATHGKRNHHHR